MARSKPAVIIVELHPQAMASSGYEGGAYQLLQQMYNWGYTHVSHSGYVGVLRPHTAHFLRSHLSFVGFVFCGKAHAVEKGEGMVRSCTSAGLYKMLSTEASLLSVTTL